jgi:hypothetical protein
VEGVGNELVSVLLADVKGVYGSPLHESQVSLCLLLTYDLAAYQNGAGRELAEAAYLLHVAEERRLIGMRRRGQQDRCAHGHGSNKCLHDFTTSSWAVGMMKGRLAIRSTVVGCGRAKVAAVAVVVTSAFLPFANHLVAI